MFAARMFAPRMFANRYFPPIGAESTINTDWWSPDLHRHGVNMGYSGN